MGEARAKKIKIGFSGQDSKQSARFPDCILHFLISLSNLE